MSCLLSPVRRRARSLSNRQVGGDSEDSWPVDGAVGVASSNAGSRRRGTWGCSAQTPAGIETQLLLEVLAAHCNIVHPAASSWGFPTVIRHTAGENVQPQLEALCFRRGRFRDGGVRWVMRGEAGRPGCLEYRSLFNPTWWFFFFPQSYKVVIALICVAGTFPIDLAKTRLQVQGQVGDIKYREIRYRGMLHAIVRIVREEGLRALYSGSVCVQHQYACLC